MKDGELWDYLVTKNGIRAMEGDASHPLGVPPHGLSIMYDAHAIMPSGTRRPATSWYKIQPSPSSSLLSHTCPTTHPKVPRPDNKAAITLRDPRKDMTRASMVDRLKDTLDHLKDINPSRNPRPLSFNSKKRRVVVVAVLA